MCHHIWSYLEIKAELNDAGVRLGIDYRKLNYVMVPNCQLGHTIDKLLHTVE